MQKYINKLVEDLEDVAPSNNPPEILYDTLTTNWQYSVQYMALSGKNIEFCTSDLELFRMVNSAL